MNKQARIRLFAAIAVALPVISTVQNAGAQTPVNQDGRALDANTRVGSDGSNDRRNGVDRRGQTYTPNQIVTGNVSGGRSFRGPVPYRDPNEFSGPVGNFNTDRFSRDSTGAPTRSNPNVDYGNSPTAVYSRDSLSTPPPPGFRTDGSTGSYFNYGTAPGAPTLRTPYAQSTAQVFESQSSMLRPGGLFLPGGLDENNQPTGLWASPLTGVMPLNPTMLDNLTGTNASPKPVDAANPNKPPDRSRPTDGDIERMREELNDRGQEDTPDGAAGGQTDPANRSQSLQQQRLDNELGTAKGSNTQSARAASSAARNQAAADPQQGNQLDNLINPDRLSGDRQQTQQGLRRQLVVPPAKQSKTYAELEKRLQQQQQLGGPVSDEQASRNQRLLGNAQAETGEGKPGTEQPGVLDPPRTGLPIPRKSGPNIAPPIVPKAGATKPGATKPGSAATSAPAPKPQASRPAPLRIKSLAEGVQAKGLRELLSSAEDLMKAGRFTSAIEKYNTAEQVAPNNPLMRLGRAQAELGATRYGSAEQHLREAVAADPALLMGQYDLESFIGRDRLAFLVRDLQQMAETEPTSVRPLVLLAYIAYGSPGLEAAAVEYLDTATQRSRRPDALIDAMRQHWVLPASPSPEKPKAQAPGNLNK